MSDEHNQGGFDLLKGLPATPAGGVYLDNNATTQVDPEVREAMWPYVDQYYGNPSSMHHWGAEAASGVTQARESVAQAIGAASTSEIVFTSGGSESDNTAIVGTLRAHPDKKHIITSAVEHPAVLGLCRELESRQGYEVTYLGVDSQGLLDLDQLRAALRPDTAIVSIMMANNETGVIFDSEAIGRIVKDAGAVFHVDAVQAVGKLRIDMRKSTIDLLSFSGHKIHAPKGIGALYVRKGTKLRPLIVGGHQERGRRAGTENVPAIVGLGVACSLATRNIDQENQRVRALRDHLEQRLLAEISDSQLNGHPTQRLANTSNISFRFIEGEGILLLLDRAQIGASSGSACTSGSLEPSHVLKAMGVPFTAAHGSVRFSLSRHNSQEQIDYVVSVMPRIVERLRAITPFSAKRATF